MTEASAGEEVVTIDLDANGRLIDPASGEIISDRLTRSFLAHRAAVPDWATDIVVFVHGWRNDRSSGLARARQFFRLVDDQWKAARREYGRLRAWSPFRVAVRWPSTSAPSPRGYRTIRDRPSAMAMGNAAMVLEELLGYINGARRSPGEPPTLTARGGQYVHCVGHSFGGRVLVEAVQELGRQRSGILGWSRSSAYPYVVDSFLIFQMAAPSDAFGGMYSYVIDGGPIGGPIVLTFSSSDTATGFWHRLAEGVAGIGSVGATEPATQIRYCRMRPIGEPYELGELDGTLVNVDAGAVFRAGRWRIEGAHSDYLRPESAHLLLSIANFSRD